MKAVANHIELIVSLSFIGLIIALTDPVDFLMPTPIQMTILALAVIVFGIFIGLMFKEKPADERETHLLHSSSRTSFIVGTIMLIIGITLQTLQGKLDHWLVWTLGLMVITKTMCLYKSNA